MDAKITKKRLSQMLSYDWMKIVLVAAAVILVWTLVFTTTATRIIPSQSFGIFNYCGTTVTTRFSDYPTSTKDIFSYEVIEKSSQDVTTGGEEYALQIMEARLTTDEADVLFAADIEGGYLQYTVDGETKNTTYLEDFLYRFYRYAYRLDGENGFLAQMKTYLDGYYGGDYHNAEALNEEKIEADFRARIKKNKDKRYKKESQIQEGLTGEIDRIQKYRQALIDFHTYLDLGYISLTEKTLYFSDNDGNPMPITGCFSVNICPNEKMADVKKDVYYRETVVDEETGAETTKTAATNMNIVIINDVETESGFEFERLAFINYLVQTYCTDLNGETAE